jgi:ferrous iron transport protein B
MGVISGMGAVSGYTGSMDAAFTAFFPTTIAALSFLFFNLFDSPCLAAITAMAKEMGSRKFFWFALGFQNLLAYCVALMVYQLGGLATGAVAFGPWTVVALVMLTALVYLLFRPDPNRTPQVTEIAEGAAA